MRQVAFVALVLFILDTVIGWGFLVHRTVNQLAVYELPKGMQPFFYRNMDYLVKESVRPDQRRNTDSTEAPKHFIDFEAYGDSAAWKMPVTWTEAVKSHSKDSLLKYGYVPFVILDVQQKLSNAFRIKNKDSILFYAADLGHYVGDLHVPLHTSINYDGQLTNQKGLHSLWESTIPEIELSNYNLSSKHKASYLASPQKKIWAAAQHAHVLVQDVFRLETEVTKNFTPEEKYRIQMRQGQRNEKLFYRFCKGVQ